MWYTVLAKNNPLREAEGVHAPDAGRITVCRYKGGTTERYTAAPTDSGSAETELHQQKEDHK
jgi:hypothetical protein